MPEAAEGNKDTLLRAAALMRERAQAATPGPWCTEPDTHAGRVWVTLAPRRYWGEGDCEPIFQVRPPERAEKEQKVADAAHIASMHPAVALTVADWLEAMHQQFIDEALYDFPGSASPYEHHALVVARTYLGEMS